jgi:hypothetical protein
MELAVGRIVQVCEERVASIAVGRIVPLHHPADGPPPPAGEEP